MNEKIGLVMATYLEAAPFIEKLALVSAEDKPFRLYRGNDHLLILSGIGKARAAMATALLFQRFSPSVILNMGAAGAFSTDFAVGDILQVDRVIEPDRPVLFSGKDRVLVPDLLSGFSSACLATQDKAIVDTEERGRFGAIADLADMEGAAFLQACRIMSASHAYIFKIVTDTPDHGSDSVIIENVRATAVLLSAFYHDSILPVLSVTE